jgi:hypothetical protein
VHFIVQSLRGYPGIFAKDNYTPWMHRYLYKDQMPYSMRSCFAVSGLYSNMTSSNKTSVFRVLCQHLSELKRQQLATTPHEKLARTQALFLYQIICLFDGDLTLRSNADRDMPLLQDWIDELCKIRENLRTPESMVNVDARGRPNPPRSWEVGTLKRLQFLSPALLTDWSKWWIFSESVRRTIVMAYAFLGLWGVMCKNNDGKPLSFAFHQITPIKLRGKDAIFGAWKYLHCWTLSRPLWEAPSSFDFFQIWKNKAHHVIDNFEFGSFIETGEVENVDDFSKLLMVA